MLKITDLPEGDFNEDVIYSCYFVNSVNKPTYKARISDVLDEIIKRAKKDGGITILQEADSIHLLQKTNAMTRDQLKVFFRAPLVALDFSHSTKMKYGGSEEKVYIHELYTQGYKELNNDEPNLDKVNVIVELITDYLQSSKL